MFRFSLYSFSSSPHKGGKKGTLFANASALCMFRSEKGTKSFYLGMKGKL